MAEDLTSCPFTSWKEIKGLQLNHEKAEHKRQMTPQAFLNPFIEINKMGHVKGNQSDTHKIA